VTAGRVLYVVVCGAGPASQVATLTTAAQGAGWQVHVIATPAALGFLDPADLETRTGHPVRSAYRPPGQPRHRDAKPDAIITAPATYNTINKLAAGIADNYALTLLAESIGQGIPVVVVPFINQALAARRPLQAAVTQVRAEGVQVLLGPGGFQPHPVGAGSTQLRSFPWSQALTEATTLATAAAAADPQQ
jgi:phosphopantothenoylcysteine synthetase/decarboxylase